MLLVLQRRFFSFACRCFDVFWYLIFYVAIIDYLCCKFVLFMLQWSIRWEVCPSDVWTLVEPFEIRVGTRIELHHVG
jgi:hypothetical protein